MSNSENKSGGREIIFVIDSSFPYYAGGIETWLYNVSARLCETNRVTILSESKTFYKKAFFDLDKRINLVNYGTLYSYSFFRKVLRGGFRIGCNIGKVRSITKALHKLIDDSGQYDVIALSTLFAATAVNSVRKKRGNITFICSARCPHAEIVASRNSLFSNYLHAMERRNLMQADLALSNGYDTIAYFERKGIKTCLMKNGLDIEKLEAPTEAPPDCEMPTGDYKILSVATLLDIKGIKELIAAVAIIAKRGYKNVSLILVGKGGQEKYKQLADALGISDKVRFLGHQSDVVPYLQHSDIICCLSGGSGLSMSALESMASGTPIVAWDTPVYRQFNTEYETMALVEDKNIELLADTMIGILLDPRETQSRIENARQEAMKYDWRTVIGDLTTYLNGAAGCCMKRR